MNWKSLSSEKIWDEYNIVVPNAQEINEEYQRASDEIVSQQSGHLDISYDTGGERQSLDLFTPNTKSASPILVFVHGGYWRVNSKNQRRFPAQAYADKGIAWAPINYRLAPEFSIDEIVDDGRNAIAWLYRNAENYNCDPNKIYVIGNSAGGHMVAMLCAHGWQSRYDVPDDVVKGGCALSGLFDLEPLLQAEANEWLKMDTKIARRNSPVYALPVTGTKMIITCGSDETNEFRRQSCDYAELIRSEGLETKYFEMEGDNHFSIIGQMANTKSCLFSSIIEMLDQS